VARIFAIAAPPLGLDALDRWGALDSLPASLDSRLWNSAGLWGLEVEDFARCAQSLALCLRVHITAGSGGQGGASSSGSLALAPKGWGWKEGGQGSAALWLEAERPSAGWNGAAASVPQGWNHLSNTLISWKEKETRKTAWL
jgi:hypothetical protein